MAEDDFLKAASTNGWVDTWGVLGSPIGTVSDTNGFTVEPEINVNGFSSVLDELVQLADRESKQHPECGYETLRYWLKQAADVARNIEATHSEE